MVIFVTYLTGSEMGSKHVTFLAFYLTLMMIVLALRIPETSAQFIDQSSGPLPAGQFLKFIFYCFIYLFY